MVVGDQGLDPGRPRHLYTFQARDPVIHGDQEIRRETNSQFRNLRTEPVTEIEAAGYEVSGFHGAHLPESADGEGATGGAIGVVISHDEDAFLALECLLQQVDRRLDTMQPAIIRKSPQGVFKLMHPGDVAGGIDTPQHRMQAIRPESAVRRPPPFNRSWHRSWHGCAR